jgi:hypothetical protein
MKTKLLLLICSLNISYAESTKEKSISLFGSKPIQISISSEGITQRKEPGYICDLDVSLGGGHYSEWGETEDDARSIVTKKCSGKSGILLCKKEKAICKQDK